MRNVCLHVIGVVPTYVYLNNFPHYDEQWVRPAKAAKASNAKCVCIMLTISYSSYTRVEYPKKGFTNSRFHYC